MTSRTVKVSVQRLSNESSARHVEGLSDGLHRGFGHRSLVVYGASLQICLRYDLEQLVEVQKVVEVKFGLHR